jgi:hypothetical protein
MQGKRVLAGDLLRAQMLLHRERIVGAALHGGVIGDHHAFAAGDPADAGDQPRARQILAVHPLRRQRARAPGNGEPGSSSIDALAHQQLAGLAVLVARRGAAAERVALQACRADSSTRACIAARFSANSAGAYVDFRGDLGHWLPAIVIATEVAKLSDSPIIQRSWVPMTMGA